MRTARLYQQAANGGKVSSPLKNCFDSQTGRGRIEFFNGLLGPPSLGQRLTEHFFVETFQIGHEVVHGRIARRDRFDLQ